MIEVTTTITKELRQNLMKVNLVNHDFVYSIPSHKVKMKIYKLGIVETYLPAIDIYKNANFVDGSIRKNSLAYRVSQNKQTFPLAHVFHSSGLLCLGNIFVKDQISQYSLLEPLETLLLYNDRVLNHGNPVLKVTPDIISNIRTKFEKYLAEETRANLESNWLKTDEYFRIGHDLLIHGASLKELNELEEIVFI